MKTLIKTILAFIIILPQWVSADNVEYNPSNSPAPNAYDSNTYTELGWTEITVSETYTITQVEINYTWETDSDAEEGSFRMISPEGTFVNIASGESDGTYTKMLTDFADEAMNGDWILWIQDSYGDGGHRASNITVSFHFEQIGPTNPNPENGASDVATAGTLSWDFFNETSTYDLWLGLAGNMSKVVDGASTGTGGSYSYSNLDYIANYEWQVIEYRSGETINGAVWGFETEGYTISSYTYTGAEQTWTVPSDVTEITVKAWGAGGASVLDAYEHKGGGSGAYSEAKISVSPGQILVIAVGEGGKHGDQDDFGGDGGWPGGGYGTYGSFSGGGGGGYSGIFLGSRSQSNALIIAGGGGGGAATTYGGAGGGIEGNNGGDRWYDTGGYGGTQTGGGAGMPDGADGSALQGGNGDLRGSQINNGNTYSAGGGGGGYYGGEGGQAYGGGGGGGSGYISPSLVIGSGTLTLGNNGEEETGGSAPNTLDTCYIAGIGDGSNNDDDAGNGLIIIKYSSQMSYAFSTTETASTEDVFANSSVNPVIRLKLVTSGSIDPISATSLTFNTSGTTNVSDIENAEVFYTTSTTFSSAIQFGSSQNTPSGAITFTGTQELTSDNNYFWLTYDVPSTATVGNIIDGSCNSVTVGGNVYSPDIEAPGGSRTIAANPFSAGSGTAADPYEIATTDQLIYLSLNQLYWSSNFIQTANLIFDEDQTLVDWDGDGSPDGSGTDGFSPIGIYTKSFSGAYDGQYFSISNLFLARNTSYNGLFGKTNAANIKRLGLINVRIYGRYYSGGIVGLLNNASVLDECFVSGFIYASGYKYVGGLAGSAEVSSTISHCYNLATVQGSNYVGGLCGRLYTLSQIDRSYNAGGVVGSYGSEFVHGLVGAAYAAIVTDSYWDTETSFQQDENPGGGEGRTTEQMKTQATFIGWDFENIWEIIGGDGANYPSIIPPAVLPTIQASSIVFNPVYNTQITLGWTSGNGANRIVFAKQANSGTTTLTDNTSYIANTSFGSGTQIGSTGWYCVYKGKSNSATVIGLSANTDYIFQVFEYDDSHGIRKYLTSTAVNNPMAQATNNTDIPSFALSFDGSGDYVNLGSPTALVELGTGSYTIEAWVKTSDGSRQAIVGNYGSTPAWCLELYSSGELRMYVNNSGYNSPSSTDIDDGLWHHVVGVREINTNIIMYVDGEEVYNNGSDPEGSFTLNRNTLIGAIPYINNFYYYDGEIDEVRIWNTARTQTQIIDNMHNRLTGDEMGLVAYYNMDAGNSTILEDNKTGGTIDGTIVNASWTEPGAPPILTWDGSESTAWETAANWDGNTLPNITYNIDIPDVANDPILSSGSGTTIGNLRVYEGSTLSVNSEASLITFGNIINTGTINIEKTIPDDSEWHFISTPNNNTTADIFNGMYLQKWDEPTKDWIDISNPEESLLPAKGYSVWSPDGTKGNFTFTGTPNTGNQSIAITYTTAMDAGNDGANLLGNPYPSYIDWDLVSGYGAKYTWNGTSYDAYTAVSGYGTGSRYISPMEGFFIVTGSNGTFELDNSQRTNDASKKSAKAIEKGLVLSANSGEFENTLYLVFDETASENFELAKDAWKFLSGTVGLAEIYSINNERNFAVDNRPETETIQLGFVNDQAGIYSIAIKEIADIPEAFLEDTKTNTFHDLTKGAYEFTWNPETDLESRFKLHFKAVGIEESAISESNILIYAADGQIFIKNGVETHGRASVLTVIDVMGRVVLEEKISASEMNIIPVNLKTGVYVVMVNGAEEHAPLHVAEKIFIK